MLTKRLIACFDMQNGMVTKARQFQNNIPIERAEVVADRVYREQIFMILPPARSGGGSIWKP